jgi:formamidopyrimidine-DNA glycosylase
VPELPDLAVYLEALAERVGGRRLERLRFLSPFVLRTVTPPASDLEGRTVVALRRLGKRIVIELAGERFVVIHLMIAGRLLFREASARSPGRITLAALDFDSGTLYLTEAGKKRRASIRLVAGEAELAALDPGGLEPQGADPAAFRAALTAENRTLKRALTDPRILAGIGNAYSDEILHAARLSPFARTAELPDEAFDRLYAATQEKLRDWTERLRGEAGGRFPEKVTAFRPGMAVHGRFGQPCPVCGTPVQRIVYAENEANYCPTCQTAGKLLADRVLSRLLHEDWPKSLEELEEKKRLARSLGAALLISGALSLGGSGGSILALDAAAPAGKAPAPVDSPAGDGRGEEPPLGRAVQPALPLPALRPDPARLARARSLLAGPPGGALRESALGGYLFLTDLEDAALFARAARLVQSLEEIYSSRYGRTPLGSPREAIVLFESEGDFRVFQALDPRLAGVETSTGLAGSGLVATFRGDRDDDAVLGTLVHELTHLLNRRAIGPSLPPWLDEGIADDLGASAIDAAGGLVAASWSRSLAPGVGEIRLGGGEAALREMARELAPGGSPGGDLGGRLGLEWEEFVAPGAAESNYTTAAAFIRMLLADATDGGVFRQWLEEVSSGASPSAEELRQLLGRPWGDLEAELAAWTLGELARLPPIRLPPPGENPARPLLPR